MPIHDSSLVILPETSFSKIKSRDFTAFLTSVYLTAPPGISHQSASYNHTVLLHIKYGESIENVANLV